MHVAQCKCLLQDLARRLTVHYPRKQIYNFDFSNPTWVVATDLFSHPFTFNRFD